MTKSESGKTLKRHLKRDGTTFLICLESTSQFLISRTGSARVQGPNPIRIQIAARHRQIVILHLHRHPVLPLPLRVRAHLQIIRLDQHNELSVVSSVLVIPDFIPIISLC